MKYWEVIADNLSKAGFSWGCVSAVDSAGRRSGLPTRIAATESVFIVRADQKLTAFLELERAVCIHHEHIVARYFTQGTSKVQPAGITGPTAELT
jgi:hypothetical protein